MLTLTPTEYRPFAISPAKVPASPDRRVTKKYRRAYIRKLKEREYRRLRAVVPALANQDKVTKVTVIEEAIRYIDELHQTLVGRIQDEESENCECCTKEDVINGSHNLFAQLHRKSPLQPLTSSNTSLDKGTMTSRSPTDVTPSS